MQPILIKKKIDLKQNSRLKGLLSGLNIRTVCSEARCPNISECFSCSHLTFLILGDICTRKCQFCNVKKGLPQKPDPAYPYRVKEAIKRLKLKHVVLTSPTRDDLPDGGAEVFYQTLRQVKELDFVKTAEVLTPDFKGKLKSLERVLAANPDIFGHNLETVCRLYQVREGADYKRSLNLLKRVKKNRPDIKTKSALILGLGEKKSEVIKVITDLAAVNCNYLAIGQYLAPGKSNYPVNKIIAEAEFMYYKERAYELGFEHVEAGTYVRSSYRAKCYRS